MINDTVSMSWRRFSDRPAGNTDFNVTPGAWALQASEKERQLQAWEDEGGATMVSAPVALVRILIVDDDIVSADALELMLHASGYSQTRVAYSALAALAMAAELRPDVALLDLKLFDMTGYELATSLRQQSQNHELRLIAVTSSPEYAGRERAREAGLERYLVKPIAGDDLARLLNTPAH